MLSLPDFGNPAQVTMVLAVEEPGPGLLKLAVSVLHGEAEEDGGVGGPENSV